MQRIKMKQADRINEHSRCAFMLCTDSWATAWVNRRLFGTRNRPAHDGAYQEPAFSGSTLPQEKRLAGLQVCTSPCPLLVNSEALVRFVYPCLNQTGWGRYIATDSEKWNNEPFSQILFSGALLLCRVMCHFLEFLGNCFYIQRYFFPVVTKPH
jgi:hypothetical protein